MSADLILMDTTEGRDVALVTTDRPYDGWLMKQGGSWKIDRWGINVDRQLDEPAD